MTVVRIPCLRITLFVLAAFAFTRQANAQTPPPFSVSVPAPVYSSTGVTHDPAFTLATPYMYDGGNRNADWFVKADGTGVLTVTLQAGGDPYCCAGFTSPGATMTVTVFGPGSPGPLLGTFAVTQPIVSPPPASGAVSITSTPGVVYRVHISAPPGPNPTPLYRLKFNGADEAGTLGATPSVVANMESPGGARWVMNVGAGEALTFSFSPTGFGPIDNTLVQVFDPAHNIRLPIQSVNPVGQSFTVPDAGNSPGPWVVDVIGQPNLSNSPYGLKNVSAGADEGVYTAWMTTGHGLFDAVLIAPAAVPTVDFDFSVDYTNPYDNPPNGPFPTNLHIFPDDVFQMHGTVTPPAGWTAVPSQFAAANTFEGHTTVTVVIQDLTAPVLTVSSNQTVKATSPSGASVTFAAPTATDLGSGVASVSCDRQSGDVFPLGTTTVHCTAADNARNSAAGSFTVTVYDNPPSCAIATPSVSSIWPANHKLVPISINGVTDPDGDAVTITITSIFQDEPLNSTSDGNTGIDGYGVGTSSAQVRAERDGDPKNPGNGRVYHVRFSASDGVLTCSGEVKVGVPHDQNKPIVDDGALYDSTGGSGGLLTNVESAIVAEPAFKD